MENKQSNNKKKRNRKRREKDFRSIDLLDNRIIYLDGEISNDLMKDLIEKSYNLVVRGLTKKKQKEIFGEECRVSNK